MNVKIPEKHYVGMVKRRDDTLPLGFMTPWGEDKSARDRMATVDRWARGTNRLEPMVIDNHPMSGFRLTKSIRTTNYGGYDHWRVEDPRGFELEISGGNLAQLLSVGTLDRGDILDECVWARYGKDNVLLSTATEEYRQAVENTRVAGIKASWRDVQPGNHVVLQNNLRGVWLGKMFYALKKHHYDHSSALGNDEIAVTEKAYHFIMCDSTINGHTHDLHVIASPKLSYIESCEVIDRAEAEQQVNTALSDKQVYKHTSGYSNDPLIASFDRLVPGKNLRFELTDIDATDLDDIMTIIAGYDQDMVIARHQSGDLGILKKFSGRQHPTLYKISEQHLAQHELRRIQTPTPPRTSFFGNRKGFEEVQIECQLDQIQSFHKPQFVITSPDGRSMTSFLR